MFSSQTSKGLKAALFVGTVLLPGGPWVLRQPGWGAWACPAAVPAQALGICHHTPSLVPRQQSTRPFCLFGFVL